MSGCSRHRYFGVLALNAPLRTAVTALALPATTPGARARRRSRNTRTRGYRRPAATPDHPSFPSGASLRPTAGRERCIYYPLLTILYIEDHYASYR